MTEFDKERKKWKIGTRNAFSNCNGWKTGGEGRLARKADKFTAICEPIVLKMWEPRCLTTVWASTACYRDSFFFYTLMAGRVRNVILVIKCRADISKD
jgi:hypothetical protein